MIHQPENRPIALRFDNFEQALDLLCFQVHGRVQFGSLKLSLEFDSLRRLSNWGGNLPFFPNVFRQSHFGNSE